jgi:lysophospholipase L1-like esterase
VSRRRVALLIVLGVVVACAVIEGFSRSILNVPENQDRWLEPYLVTGDFRPAQRRPLADHTMAEAPEQFGYQRHGLVYTYDSRTTLHGMAERGSYLFGDRAGRAAPNPARKRIFIAGGSVALGDGASTADKSWWGLMERDLRARLHDDGIDVIPAATRAFVSTQERIELELYLLPLQPDAVIFLDGFNDWEEFHYGTRPGDPFNQGVLYARYQSALFQLLRSLSDHSGFVRTLLWRSVYGHIERSMYEVQDDPARLASFRDSVANLYDDNLRRMARRCRQEEVACFFFFQPAAPLTAQYDHPAPSEGEDVKSYRAMLARIAAGAPFVDFHDLTHIFDGHPDYYADVCHPNDAGQVALAKAVADVLAADDSWRRRR